MFLKDIIFRMQNFLSLHSMQNSMDSRAYKDGICLTIFGLMEELQRQNEDLFEKHIFTKNDGILYCWSTEKLEKLFPIQNVFICCSKQNGYYNVSAMPYMNYKYFYEVKVKNNCYGIDVNSFFENKCKIPLNCKKDYFFNAQCHLSEKEVIIRLQDVDFKKIEYSSKETTK